jgi:uncharacterized protein
LSVIGWLAALLQVGTPPAIDCTRTANPVQVAVCTDAALKSLDAKMTSLYEDAGRRATAIQRKALAAQQHQWLSRRDDCSNEKDLKACVTEVYNTRNEFLGSYASGSNGELRR